MLEFVLVVIVLLIALAVLGGVAISMARAGEGTPPLPKLDRLRAALPVRLDPAGSPAQAAPAGGVTGGAGGTRAVEVELRGLREDHRAAAQGLEAAVARLETRVEQAQRRAGAEFESALMGALDGLRRDLEATRTRHDAALERLHGELHGALSRPMSDAGLAPQRERRAEATAELYGRLARFEAAIAAVTNPVLLPGEPYTPPAELLPEALAWEHWKDVGERAFAFAEYFNAHRIDLAAPAARDAAAFLTALRELLTHDLYPNLRPNPSPEQLQTVRTALERLAQDLPVLRGRLEADYRRLLRPDGGGA